MSFRLALIALLIVACGPTPSPEPAPQPVIRCDQAPLTPVATMTCAEALDAALGSLGAVHPPIATITFAYGEPCPPNARCLFVGPWVSFVVFEFAGARPVFVSVTEDQVSGVVSAGAAESWPPWN